MPQILPQKAKTDYTIREVTKPFRHGEGPVWDDRNQLLYFVDTFNATAVRLNPNTEKVESFTLPNHNSIGVILPKQSDSFHFLVGADRDFYDLKWTKDGDGTLTHKEKIENNKPKNQFNDGKVDAHGNVWIGTLKRETDLSVPDHGGSLYRIKMPEFKLEEKLTNTSISNGIAWSKNKKYMYYIDSADKKVYRYSIDLHTGEVIKPDVHFCLPSHQIEGIPDGMTIDTDDNLWVAVFGGSQILKINGKTGELLETIPMPVKYVTSCCFGGPNLDVLYATTSKLKVNQEQLKEQPLAGVVFEIKGLGVKGRPCDRVKDKDGIKNNGLSLKSKSTVLHSMVAIFLLLVLVF